MIDDKYLENQVLTAPPHQLHLMVVDGALRTARKAQDALETKDYEAAHFALNSSRDFVNELLGGLDAERAPDLADRLRALFLFVHRNLVNADLQHDPESVAAAVRILEIHRETWLQLIEKLRAEQTVAVSSNEGMSWTR